MKWECVFEKMCVPMSTQGALSCVYTVSCLIWWTSLKKLGNILLRSSRYAAELFILL